MIVHQIIIISCLVFAIHYTMQPGEIFGFLDDLYEGLAERAYLKGHEKLYAFMCKLKEPIMDCQVCMTPWHGTYLYWLIPWSRLGLPAHDWVAWLVIIIAAMGFNSIIVRLFKNDD